LLAESYPKVDFTRTDEYYLIVLALGALKRLYSNLINNYIVEKSASIKEIGKEKYTDLWENLIMPLIGTSNSFINKFYGLNPSI